MEQKEEIVNGVESLEIATITNGVANNDWIRSHNIADGSASLTTNAETRTEIIPEDKFAPIITLYTPGAADTFNYGLYEISAENLARYFNIIYDPATSTVTTLAKKKHANVAVRMTSLPQYGVKKIFTYKDTLCEASFTGNITKTGLLVISIVASIQTWKTEPTEQFPDGQDAVWTMQKVNEDGSVIDSTPAPDTFDTIQTFASSTSATSAAVTTTVSTIDADTKLEFNAVIAPSGTPVTMTLKLAGTPVAAVDFPSDYTGHPFRFTDAAGTIHTGVFASGDVTLV